MQYLAFSESVVFLLILLSPVSCFFEGHCTDVRWSACLYSLCLCDSDKGVKTVRTGWLSLVDQQSLLVERRWPACTEAEWLIYHRVRACSHLPSCPAVSLTHLAHMTNGKNGTPDLRPLTKSWLPGSVKQNKSCFKFLFPLSNSSFFWSTVIKTGKISMWTRQQ